MKTLIFCGGHGVLDGETLRRIPKGMVMVGGRPVLWHVMKSFAAYGFTDFVLALGEHGEAIRDYFLFDLPYTRDFELDPSTGATRFLDRVAEESWTVQFIETGHGARTGSRLARCRRSLGEERFFATYSDCLCDVPLDKLAREHAAAGRTATVTGVQPTSRFGAFYTEGDGRVAGYAPNSKMCGLGGWLNGGFMVFEPAIFDLVQVFEESTLEDEVFTELAKAGQIGVFPHTGFWHAVDTERDRRILEERYRRNERPWLPPTRSETPKATET